MPDNPCPFLIDRAFSRAAVIPTKADEGDHYAELDTDWDSPGGAVNGEPDSVNIY